MFIFQKGNLCNTVIIIKSLNIEDILSDTINYLAILRKNKLGIEKRDYLIIIVTKLYITTTINIKIIFFHNENRSITHYILHVDLL